MSIPYIGSQPSMWGWRVSGFNTTTLTVGAGYARSNENDFAIFNPIGNALTLDITTVGAGGCWPVGIAAQTPGSGVTSVALFAIGDSTGVNDANVIACTADFDELPAGYDSFRLVNIFILNSSAHLVPFVQAGEFEDKTYGLADPILVLNAGAATSATELDLTTLTGGTLPPYLFVKKVDLLYSFTPNSASNIASLAPATIVPASGFPYVVKTNGTAAVEGNFSMLAGPTDIDAITTSDAAIQYKVSSGSDALSLWVVGFELSFDITTLSIN